MSTIYLRKTNNLQENFQRHGGEGVENRETGTGEK